MIVLDTHALYWLASGDERLGRRGRTLIEAALADRQLAVSAITYWELAMLIAKGRLEADDVAALRRIAIDSGVDELPLDGPTAILAAQLPIAHQDPADRFIAATALRHRATLLTADDALLAGVPGLTIQDARK